jgi:ribosomal protein S18 acetylase RimI-like enzyme
VSWYDTVLAPGISRVAAPGEAGSFGIGVERITVSVAAVAAGVPAEALLHEAAGSAAGVVVVRYPADRLGWFAALSTVPGRTALAADVLMYWRLRTGSGHRPAAPWPVDTTAAPKAVDALVAECFAGYPNHYGANPLLGSGSVLAAYQDWARRSLRAGNAILLRRDGSLIGLATVDEHHEYLELLLAGIAPAARGEGWFGHLLAAVEERADRRGAAETVISTQAHNTRAQRAWLRYGFHPAHAVVTAHLVRAELLNHRLLRSIGR